MEKKQDENNEKMLRGPLNNSWKQLSTKQELYNQLPPTWQTIQVRGI